MNAREWREKSRNELLTLPSGMTIRVCRPRLQVWMMSGRLPDNLISLILTPDQVAADAEIDPEKALEQAKRAGEFVKEIVFKTVVEPKIVEQETDADDEMWFGDLSDADMQHIVAHAKGMLPDQKVPTTNGDLTAKAVEHFRDDRGRGATVAPGDNREPILIEAE